MKVIFIHHTSDFNGGSDKSLFEFILNLDKNKIKPLVCLRKGDPYIDKYRTENIQVITKTLVSPPKRLLSYQGMMFFVTFLPSIISLMYTILKNGTDVVHVNTSINIQGGLAGFFARKPVIWHVRELLGKSFLDQAVKSAVSFFATEVVTISKAVYDSIDVKKKALVYNGLDLDAYGKNNEQKDIIVNCVGRIEEWKGQHIAIAAIAKVYKKYPDVKFQFIGSPAVNKPNYYESLLKFVKNEGMTNVRFLGNRIDVPEILQNSQVLLVPTCTREPFGRTVIEGMAARNVVIATDAGGPKEIISHGENGFLVTTNSIDELTKMLDFTLTNLNKLEEIRKSAKLCVEDRFDIKRVSKKMESIFYKVKNKSI